MTVSARIHLRTRDLSANRSLRKKNGVVVRYRSPSRPAIGVGLSREDIVIPGIPKPRRGFHRPRDGTLHLYRYCALDGRQSDVTAHQNSPHRQCSCKMIFLIKINQIDKSVLRREIDATRNNTCAAMEYRDNRERSRPLTFEGLICT